MGIPGRTREAVKRLLPPKVRLVAFAYKNFLIGDPIIRRLGELVDRRRTAVDIGANIGVYSYFLARLCPRVVAYEPNPLVAERLRRAAAGNVDVVRRGLSDRPGRATLSAPIIDGRQVHGFGRVATSSRRHGSRSNSRVSTTNR